MKRKYTKHSTGLTGVFTGYDGKQYNGIISEVRRGFVRFHYVIPGWKELANTVLTHREANERIDTFATPI